MKQILSVRRGDTTVIPVQVFSAAGGAMNANQVADAFFTVKKTRSEVDGDALIAKSLGFGIEITDALEGRLEVTVDPLDTESIGGYTRGLAWDIQIVTVSGAVHTVADGLMAIEPDVTRRTI